MAGQLGADRRDGRGDDTAALLQRGHIAPARPLLEVAKRVATAASLSEGRVSLGVGIGWMREEYELLGQDFSNRGKRLDEMIPALRALWRAAGCPGTEPTIRRRR